MECGYAYTGTEIDTDDVYGKRDVFFGRAIEPTYQDCLNLCDSYPSCVALNYQGMNCTLLSSVSGTTPNSDNVGAAFIQPAATATSHAVAPSTVVAYGASTTSTSTLAGYAGSNTSTSASGNAIQSFPTTNSGLVPMTMTNLSAYQLSTPITSQSAAIQTVTTCEFIPGSEE